MRLGSIRSGTITTFSSLARAHALRNVAGAPPPRAPMHPRDPLEGERRRTAAARAPRTPRTGPATAAPQRAGDPTRGRDYGPTTRPAKGARTAAASAPTYSQAWAASTARAGNTAGGTQDVMLWDEVMNWFKLGRGDGLGLVVQCVCVCRCHHASLGGRCLVAATVYVSLSTAAVDFGRAK